MSDDERIETRYHYQYIHNVFGNFFKNCLDYFGTYLYPRFEYQLVSTYDKAVAHIVSQNQTSREVEKPNLPAIILNPTGEFDLADTSAGGKQFYRFPNLAPGLVSRVFDPIYQDEDVLVTIGFTRFKGEMELIMLLNSFYEYADMRIFFIQIFGGYGSNRVIYPRYFNTFIILDDKLYNYEYTDYAGRTRRLYWDEVGVVSNLVRTTNRTEYVYPVIIQPKFSLSSLADGSTRYGGTDRLADWKLVATVSYEVELPTYLILQSDYLAENLDFELRIGSCFTENDDYVKPPVNRLISKIAFNFGLDSTSANEIDFQPEGTVTEREELLFKTRYYHIVTESEAASTVDWNITLPETITDHDILIVNSKYGQMEDGDHYILAEDGTEITIRVDYVTLDAGDVIELYVYTTML